MGETIKDNFTGKGTEQQRWRWRSRLRHKCISCAGPTDKMLCAVCGAKANERGKLRRKLAKSFEPMIKPLLENPDDK